MVIKVHQYFNIKVSNESSAAGLAAADNPLTVRGAFSNL